VTSPADKPPGRPGFTGKTTGTSAPRFTTDDGRFVDLPPDEPITSLLVNPDGVFVNDDTFLPWQQGPVVSLPSDDTWRCPVCNLYPQIRGCEPGTCRGLVLPWRWLFDHDGVETDLVDANGDTIIGCTNYDVLNVVSPYVREVTALAPELEQLLSEAMSWLEDASAYAQKGEPRWFDERVRAALARLDAARKNG
jgi:hypothetical protein